MWSPKGKALVTDKWTYALTDKRSKGQWIFEHGIPDKEKILVWVPSLKSLKKSNMRNIIVLYIVDCTFIRLDNIDINFIYTQ